MTPLNRLVRELIYFSGDLGSLLSLVVLERNLNTCESEGIFGKP